jgi:hypothetical protein
MYMGKSTNHIASQQSELLKWKFHFLTIVAAGNTSSDQSRALNHDFIEHACCRPWLRPQYQLMRRYVSPPPSRKKVKHRNRPWKPDEDPTLSRELAHRWHGKVVSPQHL